MKNLKKTLSFVLVLAMVLGMVSTAFAFTDDATITNKEAVAVLSAIEVIDGYTDGSFQTTKTVTRGQAAAFICRLVLGIKAADKLVAIEAPFSDVPATNQFAGYIAYCVAEGIVDGYSDGTFKPGATVTTIQFGKMVLTALGYDSDAEGFTGTGWKQNVYDDLVSANLLTSISFSANAGFTREASAQMCFNALTAARREFEEGENGSTIITVGDAKVEIGGSKGSYITTEKASLLTAVYSDASSTGNGKLTSTTTATDEFGRPITKQWTLTTSTGKTVVYEKDATPVLTAVDSYKTTGSVYSESGMTTTPAITAYVNGKLMTGDFYDTYYKTTFHYSSVSSFAEKNGSAYAYFFGYGVSDELYKTGTNAYTLFATVKTAVQADADYNATKKGVYIAGEFVYTSEFAIADSATKAGDWFIVTYNKGEIASVEDAVVVDDVFTSYTAGSSIKVGDVTYSYAYEEKYNTNGKLATEKGIDTFVSTAEPVSGKTKITLVTDGKYAYVAKEYEEPELAKTYLYLTTVGEVETKGIYDKEGTTTYYGKGYLADTTEFADYNLGKDEAYPKYAENVWYKYTEKNGIYTLVAVEETMTAEVETDMISSKIAFASGSAIKSSTTTKFVVTDNNGTKTYTGYKSLPTYTSDAEDIVVDVLFTKDNSGIAAVVFIDVTEAEKEVVSTDVNTSETYLVSYKYANSKGSTNGTSWVTDNYCYTLDGEKKALTFTAEAYAQLVSFGQMMITDVVYDANGYITAFERVSDTEGAIKYFTLAKAGTVKADVDTYINVIDANTVVIKTDAFEVADDCLVYVYSYSYQTATTITGLDDAIAACKWGSKDSTVWAVGWYTLNAAGQISELVLWGGY